MPSDSDLSRYVEDLKTPAASVDEPSADDSDGEPYFQDDPTLTVWPDQPLDKQGPKLLPPSQLRAAQQAAAAAQLGEQVGLAPGVETADSGPFSPDIELMETPAPAPASTDGFYDVSADPAAVEEFIADRPTAEIPTVDVGTHSDASAAVVANVVAERDQLLSDLQAARSELDVARQELQRRHGMVRAAERDRVATAFRALADRILQDADREALSGREVAQRISRGLQRLWDESPQLPAADRVTDAPAVPALVRQDDTPSEPSSGRRGRRFRRS